MNLTSKERVRKALRHEPIDRVPANFECTATVRDKLLKHYGYTDMEQIYKHFDIDIRPVGPKYIGPELKTYIDEDDDNEVRESHWGFRTKMHWTGHGMNSITSYYPLDEIDTVEGLLNYKWPKAEWFDYAPITEAVEKYSDKAIIIGHPGPFQMATNLRSMDKLFMDMVLNPEYAKTLFDKMVEFELAYYEEMFKAAGGKIDILRPHDDYGTQISLLFSIDMWRQFFEENTRKMVELTHKYDAFYMQHSCGAVRPMIPELIRCGVDVLEPLQKIDGLYPDQLNEAFDGQIAFHGGIDTQSVLPFGTAEEVRIETEKYIQTLGGKGGYVLMSSQTLEDDVPVENIEALFTADRTLVHLQHS